MNRAKVSNPELSVLERISDGVFSLNLQGELTYMNEIAANLFNMMAEDCLGKLLGQMNCEEVSEDFETKIKKSIDSQIDLHFEMKWFNDQAQWLEVRVYPSSDGVTVLLRDISSSKKVEETIKEKHEKLVLLSEASSHLFSKKEPKELFDSLFNELSDYLDLDVYFNYMYDESSNKIQLMNYSGIPDSVAKEIEWLEMGEAICGCVARDQERIVAEQIDSSDDPRVQLVKGFGIKTYACHPLMSYGKLIGTLSFGSSKRAHFTEEELDLIYTICNQLAATLDRTCLINELTRKKEEAEKAYAAKSEFLSMMSHELRTPMNSILGFAQILEGDTRDPLTLKQKDKVQKILKSSRHLLTLINDLLEIGKIDSRKPLMKMEAIPLDSGLKESLKMISPLADRKGIKIYNRMDQHAETKVIAEPTRLTQIMLNLLSNAVKYTQKSEEIVLTCQEENNTLTIIVTDNGIGIPPEEHEKIFTPFYRIFNKEMNIEGTGIGLTLVKQFVQEMDGYVGVKSIPGQGSSFWVTLPIIK